MSSYHGRNQTQKSSQAPSTFRQWRFFPRSNQSSGTRPSPQSNGGSGYGRSSDRQDEYRGSTNGSFHAGHRSDYQTGYETGHEEGSAWGFEVGYHVGYYERDRGGSHGQSHSQTMIHAGNNTDWMQKLPDSGYGSQSTYPNPTLESSNRSNGGNRGGTRAQEYRDYFERCKGFEEDDSQWIPNIKN
ncbi:hypothetical protein GGR51DRAFT_571201 [Nemania sp. FL0031]|nr:hypothetical protein GGR51DRAFT_571201 [Nemania sp. FL0031]